jgi:hypothetical protein
MYYSVQCAEQAPLTDRAVAERDADAIPGIPDVHLVWLGSDLAVCDAWGRAARHRRRHRGHERRPGAGGRAGRYDP